MMKLTSVRWFFFCLFVAGPSIFAQSRAEKIVVQKDISYVSNGSNDQQMDLYLPNGDNFPTVLFVHGGSLTSGDRKDEPYEAIGEHFAKKGIGFAAMNYRLGLKNKWPSMAEDAAAAFFWIKSNISKWHGNPRKIFVVGHSSGALIGALISTDEKYLENYGYSLSEIAGCVLMGAMLNPSYDTDGIPQDTLSALWKRLKAREAYESLFETPEAYRDADPSHHVSKYAPPFLVLVAETEQFQPPILEQANRFADTMKSVGVTVQVEVLKNRKHMTAMEKMSEPNDPTFQRIVEFLRKH